ncbi:CRISPR-associated protein Cas5%2C subtype I-C/DVULG [Anaerotruncus sp. 2789STDY5834896]|uniref:pre-crRNA processing endonuclease n=1 Tax=uncultured Anaerotruncus sp. TaxID=905011 RepID=A0A1C6KA57_9FIRM|nr:CRISPR-associated protein Cas5%2C subtype I-C/DVULG [uncultured Anaerotruncus sp.]
MSIQVEVWGEYACFSRPEMKVERVSYDVMTPSAARGLIEAIYWHPGMRWHIDSIRVLSPIRFTNIRRNEVKSKILASNVRSVMMGSDRPLFLSTQDDIVQRAAMVLRDVHYIITAHFEMTSRANSSDNPGKFQDIVRRRLATGGCYHQPYFGCREFPAHFAPYTGGELAVPPELAGEKDLGFMLYDMDYTDPQDIRPQFFRAVLRDGLLDLRDCEVVS